MDDDPCEYCGEMEYAWSQIGVLEEEVKRLQALAISSSREGTHFYYKDAYEASAKQQTKYYKALCKIRNEALRMKYADAYEGEDYSVTEQQILDIVNEVLDD